MSSARLLIKWFLITTLYLINLLRPCNKMSTTFNFNRIEALNDKVDKMSLDAYITLFNFESVS